MKQVEEDEEERDGDAGGRSGPDLQLFPSPMKRKYENKTASQYRSIRLLVETDTKIETRRKRRATGLTVGGAIGRCSKRGGEVVVGRKLL